MRQVILCLALGFMALLACERNLTGPTSGPELDIISVAQVDHPLIKVLFVDAQHGWALTDSSGVYRTTDGGRSWEYHAVGRKTWYLDMSFVDSQNGWICGYDSTILHTSDGGLTWIRQTAPNAADSVFQHVEFVNERDGWLFTTWGDVYRTIDGGASWNQVAQMDRLGFSFVKIWGARGVAAQWNGQIFHTNDAGQTWAALASPVQRTGRTFFVDPNHGWLLQTSSGAS